jgi:hypothetical protein
MELLVEFVLYCVASLAYCWSSEYVSPPVGEVLRESAPLWLFVLALRFYWLQIPIAVYAKYVLLQRKILKAWGSSLVNITSFALVLLCSQLLVGSARSLFEGGAWLLITLFTSTMISPFLVEIMIGGLRRILGKKGAN